KERTGDPLYEDIAKVWDEVSFIKPAETEVERMNRTYLYEKDKIRHKLILMREKMKTMYGYQYPIQRRVMEERLNFLEKEFNRFDYMINPYHIQPGLLLDVDITSIKRKKATLDGMANVLNEFLHGVSKGFQDAAFASFSRRRSTVRQDIAQSFAATESEGPAALDPGKAYLDMLNAEESRNLVPESLAEEAPKATKGRGRAAKGVVDEKPAKRGRRAQSAGRDGIKEV
ncbi:MAG: cytoplasmic filament protein CfpA, partial [Termitinemataceae bacterium]